MPCPPQTTDGGRARRTTERDDRSRLERPRTRTSLWLSNPSGLVCAPRPPTRGAGLLPRTRAAARAAARVEVLAYSALSQRPDPTLRTPRATQRLRGAGEPATRDMGQVARTLRHLRGACRISRRCQANS